MVQREGEHGLVVGGAQQGGAHQRAVGQVEGLAGFGAQVPLCGIGVRATAGEGAAPN